MTTEWKIWNGWGPYIEGGLMRCERIGPSDGTGIIAPDGHDIRGTSEDFEKVCLAVNGYDRMREALESIATGRVGLRDARKVAAKALEER